MSTADKIAFVERYIKERTGFHIRINTPDTFGRSYLLELAYAAARDWYDSRQRA
jgi:hypothetical protein